MPWSKGLFRDRDHRHYFPLWGSVAALHWSGVALIVLFVWQAGGRWSDVGLKTSDARFAMMLGAFAVIGTVLVLWRQSASANHKSRLSAMMLIMLPKTLGERIFWVFMSVTAAICEELVYRGFGVCALCGKGVPVWVAVILASVAFVLIHGLESLQKS